ncbi:FHA domain-containing protein [Priestia megaterium]
MLVPYRYIRLWLSSDERKMLLCEPLFEVWAYVLFTNTYDEETTNKLAMGGRGNVAPNLLDLVWLDKIYRVK